MNTDERRARAMLLRAKIAKLPELDLRWPLELQEKWWGFAEAFCEEIASFKEPLHPFPVDKRREQAICVAFKEWFDDRTIDNRPWLHERLARAIRASDEAAGVVLVPREAKALVMETLRYPVSAYSVAELDKIFVRLIDMLAATPGDHT